MDWQKITYPRPIQKGSKIGITALSSGVELIHEQRLELVLKHLEKRGFQPVEGKCLRGDRKSVSAPAVERAKDFSQLWADPSIDAIIPPWGGELLINILEDVDFERLGDHPPKWILGYSDTSTLLFAMTTLTGISTAHGLNLMDSILENDDPLSVRAFDWLTLSSGQKFEQRSSQLFQSQHKDFSNDAHARFNLEHRTEWKTLRSEPSIKISGRMIGGCLDTLKNLIGTPYGDLPKFASRFSDSKLILYLENAGSNPGDVCRALWNMRLAGWFKNLSGLIFGRSSGPETSDSNHLSYIDALEDALADLNFPVLYDADIGHRPPQMTILNGSLAQLSFEQGTGLLIQSLV